MAVDMIGTYLHMAMIMKLRFWILLRVQVKYRYLLNMPSVIGGAVIGSIQMRNFWLLVKSSGTGKSL